MGREENISTSNRTRNLHRPKRDSPAPKSRRRNRSDRWSLGVLTDARCTQHPVEQLVEVAGHFECTVPWPDVQGLCGALRLL
jgi:hypothetical protein